MGYPMTYNRVVNRNRLTGEYGAVMSGLNIGETRTVFDTTADDYLDGVDIAEVYRTHGRSLEAEIRKLNDRWGLLMGDLRRLEADSVDERATCQHIAQRTGVDAEVVAAVLKEFLAW